MKTKVKTHEPSGYFDNFDGNLSWRFWLPRRSLTKWLASREGKVHQIYPGWKNWSWLGLNCLQHLPRKNDVAKATHWLHIGLHCEPAPPSQWVLNTCTIQCSRLAFVYMLSCNHSLFSVICFSYVRLHCWSSNTWLSGQDVHYHFLRLLVHFFGWTLSNCSEVRLTVNSGVLQRYIKW